MTRSLSAEELLAGGAIVHKIDLPSALTDGGRSGDETIAGQISLRPLTLKDVQRIAQAAKENRSLTSVLMVQQALVSPSMTVDQVSAMPAGLARHLLDKVNEVSGLGMGEDDIEEAVKAPLARACFTLSREFGWTPAECAELTIGQALLYLEMIARDERPEATEA